MLRNQLYTHAGDPGAVEQRASIRPFAQARWSNASKLSDWRLSPSGPGLYAIGIADPPGHSIGPPPDNHGLVGGLPETLDVVYVGKSINAGQGIRGRLAKHFRGGRGGNRCIRQHVRAGVEFWFCTLSGIEAAGLESMYLYFVPHLRPRFNLRGELFRHMRDQASWMPDELTGLSEPFGNDQIAPAGATSITGANRLRWSNPLCELTRPAST